MLALLFFALPADSVDDCPDVHTALDAWHNLAPQCKATLCRMGLWCNEDIAQIEKAAENCTLAFVSYNYDNAQPPSEAVLRAQEKLSEAVLRTKEKHCDPYGSATWTARVRGRGRRGAASTRPNAGAHQRLARLVPRNATR